MAPKLAAAILAATALTATSASAWPSILDRKPAPSAPQVDVHGGVWSEPAILVADPPEPRPPHPHHPHPPHDPSHDAERRECFESLKKACPITRPERDADLTKRLETDLGFLQCVEKADPTAVKPECAGRASTFVVFHDLHLVEGREGHPHPHPPPPPSPDNDEKKDTPCQSELKKKCGKQIDEFKAKLKEARVLGAIQEGIEVVQCLINNAADLAEKCKKTPSIETPELAAVQGFAGAVDLPVVQNCENVNNLCPFEMEFATLPAFRQSASVLPAHLTCLWSNRVVIGDCLPVVIEASVIPTSSSHQCKDEFKHVCGKHVDSLKKHAKEHDVVGVIKASLEVAECVVSNAEKLFKACTPHHHNEQVDPLPQDNVMITVDEVVVESDERPEPLEADEDCASRIETACPSRKTFAAVQIYSAETYASALSEKLARIKCVQASVDVIGSTCAAVYAQQLGDIESAIQGEKHPCKDQLHKSCGKQLDSFEKAIKDTSVIGIISGAVDVVDCVLHHVEDIWAKCKPLEEQQDVSIFLPSSDVMMASTKKPTSKTTKKPTPKPSTKKPTPKSTPKPTSKRGFEDEASNVNFPVLDQACLDAVAERCSGLINRLASDYAPGAHEELAEQARACIVRECGEDQAMLLLRPESDVSFTIKAEEDEKPYRFRCGNDMRRFAHSKRAEIAVLFAAIFAVAFFIRRRRNMRLRKEQEESRRQEEAQALVAPSTVVVVVDNQDSEYFRVKEDGRVAMGELA